MKILVVDDDKALREVMSRTVARWGYETETAADGVLALESLRGPDPANIVLLDLMMPNMDGVETCRHISCTIPGFVYVIILTAIGTRENLVKAMEAGAHDFLSKPVDMAELKCRLEVGRKLVQADHDARRNHLFLEAAAEGSGLGMYELDLRAQKLHLNRRLREMLGLREEDISIAAWLDLVHDEDHETVRTRLSGVGGEWEDIEYRIRDGNGSWRWIQVRGKIMDESAGGTPLRICGSIQDITHRVEKENRMFEAERLAAVHTLAAGVAHNFNNLNTGVTGNLQMVLRDDSINPQVRQWAQRALDAARRINDVTVALQRLSAQQPGSALHLHPLQQVIADVLLFMRNDLETDDIHLQLDIDSAPTVRCDPGALAQALFILLDNARHALANRQNKKIALCCRAYENQAELRVNDNGCGIPREDIRKIFSPFFTTKGEHAARGSYMGNFRGMGIGLFTMNNIIRWHEGEIRVESSLGEGSTFTILLPLPEQSPPAG